MTGTRGQSLAAKDGAFEWRPLLVLATVVILLATIPLVSERSFYYWDDTAAVFVPTWRAIGLELWAGRWPTLLPELWMGGNLAAEAQFGLWSPPNLLAAMVISQIPHLGLAAALAKICAMVLLATGTYLLLREYGALPWASVAVASAVPFAGFTLYFDASTWVAGLLAQAWTPWFWWVSRRCLHGRGSPLWVYVVGNLAVTNGNPYGVVAVLFILAGLAVEALLTRRWTGLVWLIIAGACVGTAAGVAYLPMLGTAESGWRGEITGISSNEELVPDLGMLAATSSPSMLPLLNMWTVPGSSVPATYTAWFLLPLAPWMAWRVLRGRGADMVAVSVVGGLFLVLTLGPSQLWLFRWPVRLLPYTFLVACIPFGVVLSSGLRTDPWRARAGLTLGLVGLGTWLAFVARVDLAGRHAGAALVVLALVGAVVLVRNRPRAVGGAVVAGTALVLTLQTAWVPWNADVMIWRAPTRLAAFEEYAANHPGPVVQVAAGDLTPVADRPAVASELLYGSMPNIAGVESTTSYTGIGFDAFSRTLCLNHAGNACRAAFSALWQPAGTAVPTRLLVDAVKARTVVVQRALVPEASEFTPPEGWERVRVTDHVTVFERTDAPPWPGSRLAAVSGDVVVGSAVGGDVHESVAVRAPGGGALQFARLAWPGYVVALDGRPLALEENAQGLIEVRLPPGTDGTLTLDFEPPGFDVGIPLLAAGAAAALAASIVERRSGVRGGRIGHRYLR